MITTITTTPNYISPVNAPIWFGLTSTYSIYYGFNYVVNINVLQQGTSSNVVLDTFSPAYLPPNPNGIGLMSPSRYLNTQITPLLNPGLIGLSTDVGGSVKYNIQYGESYNPGLLFSDTYYSSGYVGLAFSQSSGLQVGDLITINKINSTINPQYNGQTSVVSTFTASNPTGQYIVKTTIPWGVSSTLEGGYITNLVRLEGTSSTYWAYNGTRQYNQINTDFTSYQLGSASATFLSAWGSNPKPIFLNQYETAGILSNSDLNPITSLIVNTYDINSNIIGTYSILGLTAPSGYKKFEIGVGTANLASEGVNFTNAYGYYVYPLTASNVKTISLNRSLVQCNPSPYNNFQLAWLNRSGSFDYYNFNYKNVKTTNITTTQYKQILPYNYSVGARQDTILSQSAQESWFISTGWINETDASNLNELFTSTDVFVISGTTSYPINIIDKSYTTKTYLNDKLIEVDLSFNYTQDINLQNQ